LHGGKNVNILQCAAVASQKSTWPDRIPNNFGTIVFTIGLVPIFIRWKRRHTAAIGAQLASVGKINPSIPVQSESFYLRTAIGLDAKNRSLVYVIVSREPVTLYELATFMVSSLHCSEASS
jgi:hypothetical protein